MSLMFSLSFHGAEVRVTARPFPPYWLEDETEAKDSYHGTDYLLLHAVASALNFTVNVVPTLDWDEVRGVPLSLPQQCIHSKACLSDISAVHIRMSAAVYNL